MAGAYRGDVILRRPIAIDLFLKRQDGSEIYFEMKSPKPNKDQAVGAVRKLLTVHGVRGLGPPRVTTFYAMSYNPYGRQRESFTESVALKYLDFENMVFIGEEFWEYVGGPGAYSAVLDVYHEVGKELGPVVWNRLSGRA